MQDLINRAAGLLERRFLKNAFLPVLLLPLAVYAPWGLRKSRLEMLIRTWSRQDLIAQVLQVALTFALVWFTAAIVASQWRNIIRLYEGYPLMRIARVGQACASWYWRRAQKFENVGDRWRLYYDFPATSHDCLPTRLGNIIRAAERYSYYRYGADTIVVWPRLYHLLERDVVDDVEDARASLEFLLVVSLWFVMAGWGGAIFLAIAGDSMALAIVWSLGGTFGAYLAYLSAIRAAVEYGEQLRSTMELYRLQLLEHLRIPVPTTVEGERAAWGRFADFVGAGDDEGMPSYSKHDEPSVIVRIAPLL